MAKVHESAVTLRFSGDDLDPEAVSTAIGLRPTKGVRKGEIWFLPNGTEMIARTGMWHFHIGRKVPGDLDKPISSLFSLASTDLDVWRDLSRRYHGHLFVGLMLKHGNEGIAIEPEVLAAIGARGLRLDFDIYTCHDAIDDRDAQAVTLKVPRAQGG
ncbi:DUF4279 domain-containing protein [Ancylobacter terrae]|uniref:DUF4279 domain-containing protein n=1 Tax=Ancylobacter sp. sgz301288 TaxID=3342077 RepID=UPI00385AED8F